MNTAVGLSLDQSALNDLKLGHLRLFLLNWVASLRDRHKRLVARK